MNFKTNTDERADFQIAPMLDIVFLLLVFFIATYAMAQMERELSVTIPEAAKADEPIARINEIVVNLTTAGELRINQQTMTLVDLQARLKRLAGFGSLPGVIIRADADCPMRYVVAVMGVCREMNVPDIFMSAVTHADTGGR